MSIAFLINPASTISRFLCNYPEKRVMQENLGFLNKKDSGKPLDLNIQVIPISRFFKPLHKVCQCCFGFSSFGAKSCASSTSVNLEIKDTGDYEKKIGLQQNEALNIGAFDTSFGGGGGQGNRGGGWTGINDDNGGIGESADWEKVKGWCWWLFDAWKYHFQLAHPSSSSVFLFSRIVMPIVEEIVGSGAQDLDGLLMRLLMAICYPMFVLIPMAFSGFTAALVQMFLLFATGVLGFVLVALFLFAKFYLQM